MVLKSRFIVITLFILFPFVTQAGQVVVNSLGMKFVYIKPGTFMMGSSASEAIQDNDEKQHKVTLTKGYYIQTTEVTQGQWFDVMGNKPWSVLKGNYVHDDRNAPAVFINWSDSKEFIRKLNGKEGGHKYRLPTEAEWEYACRAGSSTAYSFGNDPSSLKDYAWYKENTINSGQRYAHAVAQKKANPWGLYDMYGNISEWCEDWKGDYSSGEIIDPKGPINGSKRVMRGGSWITPARCCRTADRSGYSPLVRANSCGLRIVMYSDSEPES